MSSPRRRASATADVTDLALALTYVGPALRPAIAALFAIDQGMADVLRTTSEPGLGAIRLAWWRERLEALDQGVPPPAEPRLRAAAEHLIARGVGGGELAALETPWLRLLDPFPWGEPTVEAIRWRGRHLFALGGRLLGSDEDRLADAGGVWALVDAARHCSDAPSRQLLIEHARATSRSFAGRRFEGPSRGLTALTAAAMRDMRRGEPFEPEGRPGRAAAMLAHRLTGRLPRHG